MFLSATFIHFDPPSSDLYNAFFLDSIKAYISLVLLGEIANPILPNSPLGNPSLSVRFIQFSPPSCVT